MKKNKKMVSALILALSISLVGPNVKADGENLENNSNVNELQSSNDNKTIENFETSNEINESNKVTETENPEKLETNNSSNLEETEESIDNKADTVSNVESIPSNDENKDVITSSENKNNLKKSDNNLVKVTETVVVNSNINNSDSYKDTAEDDKALIKDTLDYINNLDDNEEITFKKSVDFKNKKILTKETIISNAKNILKEENADNEKINKAASDLVSVALSTREKKKIKEIPIDRYKKIIKSGLENIGGEDKYQGKYSSERWVEYKPVIDRAKKAMNSNDINSKEMSNITVDLLSKIRMLMSGYEYAGVFEKVKAYDKETLKNVIDFYENIEQYQPISSSFNKIYEQAIKVYNNENATQKEVNQASYDLIAFSGLLKYKPEPIVRKPNKKLLRLALNYIGEPKRYTDESLKGEFNEVNFRDFIEQSKNTLNSDEATADQVDFATRNLILIRPYLLKKVAEEPGEEKPGKEEPGEEKPGKEEPGEEKPGKEEPGEEKPGEEKPGEEEPGKEEPGEEEPGKEEPGEEKPGEEKPGKEEPGEEKPGEEKPGEEEPGEEEPGKEEPGEEKPGKEEPGEEEPGEEKPGKEEPGEEKPGEEKPGEEEPSEEKPGKEEPGEEKPGEDKPDEEKPVKKEKNKVNQKNKKQIRKSSDNKRKSAKYNKVNNNYKKSSYGKQNPNTGVRSLYSVLSLLSITTLAFFKSKNK